MIKKGICLSLTLFLSACSIQPPPFSVEERYAAATADVKGLFDTQKNFPKKIDYYEALARSIKYNLDYRIKLTNIALQAGQLSIAELTMFPALNTSGSLYSRNNQLSSFGVTSTGAPTDVLNSTPNTLRSARVALSWNVLDFGLGYVKSKEQGDRVLIAQEEARKQEQSLAQDLLIAYWDAYNSQELIKETRELQSILFSSKAKLSQAMTDKLIPKENILNYQAALLEGNRRLIQLSYKYHKAMLDLKHLINLPPDQEFTLAAPPFGVTHQQDLSRLDFAKLDAITLVKRPELKGQDYERRIAERGVQVVILQSLPGITFNGGWNYNSNKFLINTRWVDRSVDVAWNLLNLASLPTTYKAAKAQIKYETLKRMALTITALTQTRYAYWHYTSLAKEYKVTHSQLVNAQELFKLHQDREIASLESDQEVILAKLKVLTTTMDEHLLLSDLSNALGELYLSCGSDLLPMDVEDLSISELAKKIRNNFTMDKVFDFNKYVDQSYKKLFAIKKAPRKVTLANKIKTFFHHDPAKKIATQSHKKLYTIQVFGSYFSTQVKQLPLKQSAPLTKYYGVTEHNHKTWYIVTLGKFDSVHAAKQRLATLDKSTKKLSPWIRVVDDMKLKSSIA